MEREARVVTPRYASVSRGQDVFSQQVVNRVLGRDPPLERHATRTGNLEAIAVGSDVAHPGDEAGRASGGLPRSDDNKDAVIRAIALSQKARKERRSRTYLWGDRRLGEVRSIGR